MIFELPRNKGLFVSQKSGKTASSDNPNNFSLSRSKQLDICPVTHIESYVKLAKSIEVDLGQGHLFRIIDMRSRTIINEAVTSHTMTDRL